MKKIMLMFIAALSCVMMFNQAIALQKLTLVLDWFVNPDHAPIYVAQQQGFFKEQGLEVKIVAPADPTDAEKMVAAGKAELGISYQPQLMMAIDNGLPLKRAGTLIATPLNCLAVLQSSPVKSIADLKGKRIAIEGSQATSFMLRAMLHSAGLKLNDVKFVTVKYNLSQALLSGRVDAASGMVRNFEPLEMKMAGKPVRLFYPEDYGVPNYDELVFITNEKLATDPRIKKFLFAQQQAVNYLINHPQKSWLAFAKANPQLDNMVNHKAWVATLPRFALRPAAIEQQRFNALSKVLKQQGMLKHNLALKSYAIQ